MYKKKFLFSLLMTVSVATACSTESLPPSVDSSDNVNTENSNNTGADDNNESSNKLAAIKAGWKLQGKEESAKDTFDRIITAWRKPKGPLAQKRRTRRRELVNAIQGAVEAVEADEWEKVPTHLSKGHVEKLQTKSNNSENIKRGNRADDRRISPEDKAKLDQYLALLDRYLDLPGVQN